MPPHREDSIGSLSNPTIFPPASFLARLEALAPATIKPYAKALKNCFRIPKEMSPSINNSAGSNTSSKDMLRSTKQGNISRMSVPYTAEEEQEADQERERLQREKERGILMPTLVCRKLDAGLTPAPRQQGHSASKSIALASKRQLLAEIKTAQHKEYSSSFPETLAKSKDLDNFTSWDKISAGSVSDYIPPLEENKGKGRWSQEGPNRHKKDRKHKSINNKTEHDNRTDHDNSNKHKLKMNNARNTKQNASTDFTSSASDQYSPTAEQVRSKGNQQSQKPISVQSPPALSLPHDRPASQRSTRRFSSSRVSQVTHVDASLSSRPMILRSQTANDAGSTLSGTGALFPIHNSTAIDSESEEDIRTQISPNSSARVAAELEQAMGEDAMKVWPMKTSTVLPPSRQKRHSLSRAGRPQDLVAHGGNSNVRSHPPIAEESALFQRKLSGTEQESRDIIKRHWNAKRDRDTAGRKRIEGGYASETEEALKSDDLFTPTLEGVRFEEGDDGRRYDGRLEYENTDEPREEN